MPLSLQPSREDACSLHLAGRALAAAEQEETARFIGQTRDPASWLRTDNVMSMQSVVYDERERMARVRQLRHAVASCLGPRLLHALARITVLGEDLSGTRRAHERRHTHEEGTAPACPLDGLSLSDESLPALVDPLNEAVPRLLHAVRVMHPDRQCAAHDLRGSVRTDSPPCTCWTLKCAWRDHLAGTGLCDVQPSDPVQLLNKMHGLRAAVLQAQQELRAAALQHMMQRLVDRNLRAIKTRLWRPEGHLVQKRTADIAADEGVGNASGLPVKRLHLA